MVSLAQGIKYLQASSAVGDEGDHDARSSFECVDIGYCSESFQNRSSSSDSKKESNFHFFIHPTLFFSIRMQNKFFKPHPISMFWGDTISVEFWTILRHSAEISELDDQTSISCSEAFICSILPYELIFLKEICVCTGGDLQCTVWEILPGMRGKDCEKHTCFLVWILSIHPVPSASSLFSCASSHQ